MHAHGEMVRLPFFVKCNKKANVFAQNCTMTLRRRIATAASSKIRNTVSRQRRKHLRNAIAPNFRWLIYSNWITAWEFVSEDKPKRLHLQIEPT